VGLLSSTSYDLGVGNFLGTGDGTPSADLHANLDLALQYLANWYKATKGSDNQDLYWAQIDQVRAKVELAERTIDPANIFPSNSEVNLYNDASAAFADEYQTLALTVDTLPQPALLDQAADVVTTIVEMPSTIVTKLANVVGSGLGNATKQFFLTAWPFLAVGAVVLGVYVFRRPLLRLAGSVK
jgi:hypothetical protein